MSIPSRSRFARSFVPRLETLEDRRCPSTLTVRTAADSGDSSLRAAIAAAAPGDTIIFDHRLDGQTIALTSGQLTIAEDLSIVGPGAGKLTVSGGGLSRVFAVGAGDTVSLSGLTIANGSADEGGGILNAGAGRDVEHPARPAAADGQSAGPRPQNAQVFGDPQLTAGQGNCLPRQRVVEDDRIAGGRRRDGGAERA